MPAKVIKTAGRVIAGLRMRTQTGDPMEDARKMLGLVPGKVLLFWPHDRKWLTDLAAFRRHLPADGAIWVVLKRREAMDARERETLPTEEDVKKAAKAAGMVDAEVRALTEKEFALKLIIKP